MEAKAAPLKSATGQIIGDKARQMDRWVEHYSELHSRESVISDAAFKAIESLPSMMELDKLPTTEELSKAISSLPTGKAPGLDGIPPEAIRWAKGTLFDDLHGLLCQCWAEGQVPQDMTD